MKLAPLLAALMVAEAAPAPASQALSVRADNPFLSFLDSLFGDSNDESPAAPAEASESTPSSSGSGFNFNSLFLGRLGRFLASLTDDSSESSQSATPTSVTQAAPTSATQPPPESPTTQATGEFTWFTSPEQKTSAATSTTSTAPTTLATSTSSTSSSTPASTGVSGQDKEFAKEILDAHNNYRADHGVGPLSWDQSAYDYAQNNADNYDCSGVLTHTHGPFGENLAAGFKDGPAAVKAWYVEGETYDYSYANTYDHFTQVVWKDSTKVGCAYKDCRHTNWGLYIVCEYDPPGNVVGRNKQNVLPPK